MRINYLPQHNAGAVQALSDAVLQSTESALPVAGPVICCIPLSLDYFTVILKRGRFTTGSKRLIKGLRKLLQYRSRATLISSVPALHSITAALISADSELISADPEHTGAGAQQGFADSEHTGAGIEYNSEELELISAYLEHCSAASEHISALLLQLCAESEPISANPEHSGAALAKYGEVTPETPAEHGFQKKHAVRGKKPGYLIPNPSPEG